MDSLSVIAAATLGPLLHEYGFAISQESKSWVRYESGEVYLQVAYDLNRSYELSVDMGIGDSDCFNVDTILTYLSTSRYAPHCSCQSSNWDGVRKYLEALSARLRENGNALLKGDNVEALLSTLEEYRNKESLGHTNQILLNSAQSRATDAWKSKDYASFAKTLAPFEGHLSGAERKKLEYAKKHASNATFKNPAGDDGERKA